MLLDIRSFIASCHPRPGLEPNRRNRPQRRLAEMATRGASSSRLRFGMAQPGPTNPANWREISRPARALGAQSPHPRTRLQGEYRETHRPRASRARRDARFQRLLGTLPSDFPKCETGNFQPLSRELQAGSVDVILRPRLVRVPATVATAAARNWRPRRSAACAPSRGVSMAAEIRAFGIGDRLLRGRG